MRAVHISYSIKTTLPLVLGHPDYRRKNKVLKLHHRNDNTFKYIREILRIQWEKPNCTYELASHSSHSNTTL